MLAFRSAEDEKRFGLANVEFTFADVEIEPKSTYKYSAFTVQF